ncbi:hypothetical protein [Streptomyces sp. JNUCC 63]
MRNVRRVGAVAAVVAAVVVLAGCGGGSDKPDGKATVTVTASPPESAPTVEPRDALAEYQRATYSGCTDADDCQEFMTRKLAAAVAVKEAMEAKDRSLYAVPIGYVAQAEREADHYGRDNLGCH